MPAEAVEGLSGSFDDVPDVALRTVLAVPLTLPPLSATDLAPAPPRSVVRSTRHSRHRRRATTAAAGSPIVATVQVGLSAALVVFVAVALGLGLVQLLIR